MKTNLQLAIIELEKAKQEFQIPVNFNLKKFQELANGFFQGEGHIGCRVRDTGGKLSFLPVFTMNQNLNEKSLLFFVTLWQVVIVVYTLILVPLVN